VSVSSVLGGDSKQYGKQNMFNNDDETCWNSSQGSPQSILIEFKEVVSISGVKIVFQGGFVGKSCLFVSDDGKQVSFYPKDNNEPQTFEIATSTQKLKIVFTESTDFFGRITIYSLDVLGNE
jgi:hypothetical protein